MLICTIVAVVAIAAATLFYAIRRRGIGLALQGAAGIIGTAALVSLWN